MNVRILILTCLLILPVTPGYAGIVEPRNAAELAQIANQNAEQITDVEAFLMEVEDSLELARNGGYGQLKRGAMGQLEAARDRIYELLDGRTTARDLSAEDRIALYNAQELIATTLRKNEPDRVVCQREVRTGSRLTTNECLTVAQREERAQTARESTDKVQRGVCYPAEGNPCK